jgi:Glycosyl hydrolase family 65 central catalytic domain/Glycosyl hydrolase family 65, C-terminal domain
MHADDGERESLDPVVPEVDRRFEAVVLWSTTPAVSASAARSLRSLGGAGAVIGLLAPAPLEDLVGRLLPHTPGDAPFLFADTAGAGIVMADGAGLQAVRDVGFGQSLSVLDAAGGALVSRLVELGLRARVLPRSESAPSVAVDLGLGEGRHPTSTRLKRFLLTYGITGVPQLVDLASEAARSAGVDDPRVRVDGNSVEIAAIDAGDVATAVLEELWRLGVDPHDVLLVIDGLAGVPHRPAPVIEPDVRAVTPVVLHGGPAADGVVTLAGGATRLRRLLADQLRRRRRQSLPETKMRPGWSVEVQGLEGDDESVWEALLTVADGRVGVGGAPLGTQPGRQPWVVASGVYQGSGARSRLLTAPVVFKLEGLAAQAPLVRVLDMRSGVLYERSGSGPDALESLRFVSLARPGTAVLRARYAGYVRTGAAVLPPVDDAPSDGGRDAATSWMRVAAPEGGVVAASWQRRTTRGGRGDDHAPARAVLDRVAVYRADPDALPETTPCLEAAAEAAAIGFDRLLTEHRRAWAQRWEASDVVVEGDEELQLGIRFALFHLMASVADEGEAAVGARGLSGAGYGGHVFWDADTFVLPFLAATHPASARAMLEYRIRRLPAALAAARAAGRSGARFPWESARTGEDVTPTSAHDRAGNLVAIRTGQLEEHIVAQVPWAACCYVDWTGDVGFARGPGRRLLVETARYWASRIRLEPDGTAHIYGVVGPDEYHEPVDDNAFTNVMARWNLRRAAEALEDGDVGGSVVDSAERARWLELAEALFDGYDGDTGIYEQFAGFKALENLVIAEVAPRRPIAADLLLGAERTRRAQVVKQADVLLLHHLVPDEVVPGSLEPNLRYYEPRTAHGSSLSPGIHASVLARARRFDAALDALRIAARLDLDDLTGSTAQGLHVATMGGLWQALAFGFMGMRPRAGRLHLDPVLPPSWSALEIRVQFRGAEVRIRKEHDRLVIHAGEPLPVVAGDLHLDAARGRTELVRRGARWEVER